LALAAAAGDGTALMTFIRVTQGEVYRFLAYLCAHEVTESLTQETYLRALRSLPSFAGRASARIWLLSIARRVAADQIRRANDGSCAEAVVGGDAVVPADSAHHRSGWQEGVVLRELVAGLDADRREAFVLTQVLGLDYAAAAEVCDCPIGSIRSEWPGHAKTSSGPCIVWDGPVAAPPALKAPHAGARGARCEHLRVN
jgi:RNA polymerase sigma-70 factor (ECF subfamily)